METTPDIQPDPFDRPRPPQLDPNDLTWVVRHIPKKLRRIMENRQEKLILAGGFIRSCIQGDKINDIDLFVPNELEGSTSSVMIQAQEQGKLREIKTKNAITLIGGKHDIQIITRWVYTSPLEILPSFDFTMAQAAVWYANGGWHSACSERYYQDLAAKRLIYTSPARNEDAGGSALRVLKFYQRGWRMPLDSYGAVIARLVNNTDLSACGKDEPWIAKVLTGKLREVDPLIDPTHAAHLPFTRSDEGKVEGKDVEDDGIDF